MAQLVISAAGAAVGFMVGGPAGAKVGWMVGSMIGSTFAPTQKSQGPRLEDLTVTTSSYGTPIPYIAGHPRVSGQIVWASAKREIATTESAGKGGGGGSEYTTFTYEVDLLYLLSDNEIDGIPRIWNNGELIYSILDGSDADTLDASANSAHWTRMTVYTGAADQLPDPDYEAVVGSANAPAYRGRGSVFIKSLQLGGSGQIPNLTFEVASGEYFPTHAPLVIHDWTLVGNRPQTIIGDMQFNIGTNGSGAAYYDYDAARIANSGTVNQFIGYSTLNQKASAFSGGATLDQNYQYIHYWMGVTSTPTVIDYGEVSHDYPDSSFWCGDLRLFGASPGDDVVYWTDDSCQWTYMGSNYLSLVKLSPYGVTIPSGWGHRNSCSNISGSPVAIGVNIVEVRATRLPSVPDARYTKIDGTFKQLCGITYAGGVLTQNALGPVHLPTDPEYNDTAYWANQRLQAIASGSMLNTAISPVVVSSAALGVSTFLIHDDILKNVVDRVLSSTNIPSLQCDTTQLSSITRPVRAMAIGQVSSARTVLEMLAAAYHFDCVLSDKLYFMPRGTEPVSTLTFDELGVAVDSGTADPLPLTMANELEIPAQMAITYANIDGDYQTDTQYSDRLLTGQESTSATSLPLGFTSQEAKQIADATLTDKAVSALSTTAALGITRAKLEPTDVVILTGDDGSTYRMRVTKKSESQGVITLGCVADDASVFTQSGTTDGGTIGQTTVLPTPTTTLVLMDIPLLRDADNVPGHYAAVKGSAANWTSCALFESADDVTYTQHSTISGSAVMGTCTTTLGAWTGGNFADETNTLTVDVGVGQLSSVTHEQMLSSQATNAALVGNELIQFREAVLVSAGVYTLRGLLRGKRGTEWTTGTHGAAERFVVAGTTGLRFIAQQTSDIGQLIYYKAPASGQKLSAVTAQSMTLHANVLNPLSPVNVRVLVGAGGTLITWDRRTRLSENWLAGTLPLGETAEAYTVKIYNGAALIRTIACTTPSATYTKAMQVIDSPPLTVTYTVAQVSATVGAGYAASISGPSGYISLPKISSATLGGTFESGKAIVVSLDLLRVTYTTTVGDATLGGAAISLAAAVNAASAAWSTTADGNSILVSGPLGYNYTFDAAMSSNADCYIETKQVAAPATPGSRRMIYGVIAPPGGSGTLSSPPTGTVFSVSVHNSVIYKTYSYTTTYYTEDVVSLAGSIMGGLVSAFNASGDQASYDYTLQVDNRAPMPGLLFTGPLGAAGWAMEITCSSPTVGSVISLVSPEALPYIPVDQPQVDWAIAHGTVEAGQVFSIVLDGTPYTHTATGSDTTQTVAVALAAAIGGATFTVTTPESNMPRNNGYFFYITRSVGNVPFTSDAFVSTSTMTITTSTVQAAS